MKSVKNVYIFIGPPGAGKGSLSQHCKKKAGWHQLSTGVLCRKHINEQTDIGKKIDFAIKSGKLIADELIIDMVHEWLITHDQLFSNIILDGFPRTVTQAEALHQFLLKKEIYKLNIIKLYISDSTVKERIAGRLICKNNDCQMVYSEVCQSLYPRQAMTCDNCLNELVRRSDDAMGAVQNRLQTYHMHEKNLLDFYSKNGFIINQVNVEQPLNKVFEEFQALLDKN